MILLIFCFFCLNLFRFRVSACFAYDKTVINQRRFDTLAFEDHSEKNSMWIWKWTTLLGIFCKKGLTPTATSCYHVHADAHLSAALLCYFRCYWFRNLAAVNCIYCSIFQHICCNGTFRKCLRCSWNPLQWSKCLYCYNRINVWLRISSQAISVCFSGIPGSHSRNPEVPRNLGWKTLAYCIG